MAQLRGNKEADLDNKYINESTARKQAVPAATRRNPYLVDYSGNQKRNPGNRNTNLKKDMDDIQLIYGQGYREAPARTVSRQRTGSSGDRRERSAVSEQTRRPRPNPNVRTASPGRKLPSQGNRRKSQAERRKKMLRRRIILGILEGMVIICLAVWVFKGMDQTETVGADQNYTAGQQQDKKVDLVTKEKVQGIDAGAFAKHPSWEENYLTISEYSRPGDPIGEVKNIFVHYTANPKTSAAQNRSYFEQLKDTKERGASAHFIIGYEGEILQLVPLDEIAYAVMGRNEDSLSIECCFLAADGSFTQETYDSLIQLLSWLTETYGLQSEDILRHYDCGGKKCPIYYTENEDAWERLKKDVADYTL